MMRNRILGLVMGATVALTSLAAAAEKTIVEIAAGNKDFSTLVSLVKSAGLVDTLNSKGPFTVFAPTNAAFAKLPKATLEALGKDKEALKKVLLFHVVPGNVMAKDALPLRGRSVETASKERARLGGSGNTLTIAGARVVATDIKASNGVIHVIDSVMIPPSMAPKRH